MSQYDVKNVRSLFFRFAKADTTTLLRKELLIIFLLTLLFTYLELTFASDSTRNAFEKLFVIYSLLGFVISLLLVFRTNTAYDRWWEGRRKWGELVNDSRNAAVKLAGLGIPDAERQFFARHISNFAIACKEHLRDGCDLSLLDLEEREIRYLGMQTHLPSGIVSLLWEKMRDLSKAGVISEIDLLLLDRNFNGFLDSIGACERIKSSPIPYSYGIFFKKFIFIYVTTLPLALVPNFHYWSALIATFIFYVFVSIEVIAEEIEDPFGKDENDLPTDELAAKIGASTSSVLLSE